MDIWHRVGRIVRFSNLGTLLFFTLNILLIVAVFGSSGSIVELICIYFFTVAISLLVNEGAGLHNHFIRVVNLHTAAIGDMKQILIMAVDKSDFLTIRVVLICHLRFPPFSNSILNFVLPSSDTSIKTVASKVLPVLSDLQFLSFTLPEPSNFCAVAEVMLLPMLAK